MMQPLRLSQLVNATGGQLQGGDCEFSRVSTDTRKMVKGDLFVALKGPNFDANQFLSDAAGQGAVGLVVERTDKRVSLPQLQVADTTVALGQIAHYNRQLFAGPVVGITGSCGKTTVKSLLHSVLSPLAPSLVTLGNLNNQIGVPLTLLQLSPEHRYAVIEMGANALGEIDYLAKLAEPDVALVTNAMRAHIEGFGSLSGVVEEKGKIYSRLGPQGTAVINFDDSAYQSWRAMAGDRPFLSFSVSSAEADVYAENIVVDQDGSKFDLVVPGQRGAVSLSLLGTHNIANAVAVAACAHALGLSVEVIAKGLSSAQPVAGRMQQLMGVAGASIINDSYNANPDSVKAAIDALAGWPQRKIMVLGALAELGPESDTLHEELGCYAKEQGVSLLFTLGEHAEYATRGFGEGAEHFQSREAIVDNLLPLLDEKTVVLIKGSRVAQMDKVVTALTTIGED